MISPNCIKLPMQILVKGGTNVGDLKTHICKIKVICDFIMTLAQFKDSKLQAM